MNAHTRIARTLAVIAFVAGLLVAVPASAGIGVDTDSVSEETVMSMGKLLKVWDGVIPEPARLRSVSDDPALALMAVHADARLQDEIRGWALTALTQYGDDARVFAYLEGEVNAHDRNPEGFRALAYAFAQACGADAIDVLAPYIAARNEGVQLAAVDAIGMFGGTAGVELLAQLDRGGLETQLSAAISAYVD